MDGRMGRGQMGGWAGDAGRAEGGRKVATAPRRAPYGPSTTHPIPPQTHLHFHPHPGVLEDCISFIAPGSLLIQRDAQPGPFRGRCHFCAFRLILTLRDPVRLIPDSPVFSSVLLGLLFAAASFCLCNLRSHVWFSSLYTQRSRC